MPMFIPIIYNAALLTLLILVLEIFLGERFSLIARSRVATGLMLGLISLSVMLNPWQATEGVVFDTRSVLLSLGGLFFGAVPAAIAAGLASAYRIYDGGAGVYMGVSVIWSSVIIGVVWRRRKDGNVSEMGILELLTFGLLVHSAMLLLTFALPAELSTKVISIIALPVLTIYPLVTVALGFLLVRSLRRSALNSALRENEEKFRLLADNTVDAIWIMDLEARFLYLNPAVDNLLGYSSEEMTGRGLWEFCDAENFQIMKREIDKTLEALPEQKEALFEAVMLKKDGSRIEVEITGRAVLNEHGEPATLQGVTRDITERKRFEAERERLRLAIEHSVETVMITDTEGIILYVNPAFESTSGYTREEAVGRNAWFLESGQHPRSYYDELWSALRSGKTWTGKSINRRKDGSLYTEEASIAPVFDREGRIINFVSAKRDVTYEIELEQQLWQSQKMEAVGQLAGGIAHDFNNILQAMMGYCEMLRESTDPGSENFEFIQELQKGTEKAADLTRQLLTFSRRQALKTRDVDLNEIISDMLRLIGRTIGEQIELIPRLYQKSLFIHADSGNIEQVLMNLCVNARDAMPGGGKLIIETGRVHINGEFCQGQGWVEEGNYAVLTISDTGFGIDKIIQGQIFEPFFTTKEVGRGTGLGLATAYAIINQHNGAICVDSEKGRGATFTIYLPLIESAEAEPGKKEPEQSPAGGKETVLLAEDDPEVRKLAKMILNNAGYRVISADNGEKAILLIRDKSDQIDIAIIDVVMPKRSGKEVLEYYHRVKPDGKVLLVSGYSVGTMDVSNFREDQVAFISKPFGSGPLLRAVRTLLDG